MPSPQLDVSYGNLDCERPTPVRLRWTAADCKPIAHVDRDSDIEQVGEFARQEHPKALVDLPIV